MFELTREPLSVERATSAVGSPSCGAVAVFVGTARDSHGGKRVVRLEYEAYEPMARRVLERIEADLRARHPVGGVYVAHRTGAVPVGEASLVIAVSTPHRPEAFAALRECLERIKGEAPIWKRELYEDGNAWVDNAACAEYSRKAMLEAKPDPSTSAARFHKDMTVGDAMRLHPRVPEVFAAFHLGGCSHCGVSESEVIENVCLGYGIPVDELVGTLNTLLDGSPRVSG